MTDETTICPVCGGYMGKRNFYCKLACWKERNESEEK